MGFKKMFKRATSPAKQFAKGLQNKLTGIVTAVPKAAKTVAKTVSYPVRKGIQVNKDLKQMKAAYKDYQKLQQVQGQNGNGDLQAQYQQYLNSGKAPVVGSGAVPKSVGPSPTPSAPSAPAVPKATSLPAVQTSKGGQQIQKATAPITKP